MDIDTDYGGYDMSMVHSNGIEDCYQKCKDLVGCQSFLIIYNLEMFEYIEGELNECHLKSRKYGVGATAKAGLKAVNMDCLIGLCYFPMELKLKTLSITEVISYKIII